jgi:hypothetical protein
MESLALMSKCGSYRYWLKRVWSSHEKLACFVMLNPSTADASEDDPTIRRCIGFAKREGATGLVVVNLFALRSTDPTNLKSAKDPVGPDNLGHMDYVLNSVKGPIICAWGAMPFAAEKAAAFAEKYEGLDLLCLGQTANGSPRHPLYIRKNEPLKPWRLKDHTNDQ